MDPVSAFWRDVWARMSQAAAAMPPFGGMPMPGAGAMPGMAGMPGAPGAMAGMPAGMPGFLTPEAAKKMQAAFFESMAQYAEQFMRSPQFLESMKKSMDQALQFRRQMDDFLKHNMAESFEAATGGANSELLGAIRHLERTLTERLDDIARRVEDLEGGRPAPAREAKRSSPARKPARR